MKALVLGQGAFLFLEENRALSPIFHFVFPMTISKL
jgi:hypothetical protein